jgi:hypothetical protein
VAHLASIFGHGKRCLWGCVRGWVCPDLCVYWRDLIGSVLGGPLTGEGGLLTSMVREVLQTGLDVEMADHLGYEPYESIGRGSGNSRNGAYPKTVRTDVGPVERDVLGLWLGPSGGEGAKQWMSNAHRATQPRGRRRPDRLL